MKPAVEGMREYLDSVDYNTPTIPVIANVSAKPLTTADEVKKELIDQLTNPVQWQRTVEYMVNEGVSTIIEIGPGKVLTGLVTRINKDITTINIGDLEAVKALGS